MYKDTVWSQKRDELRKALEPKLHFVDAASYTIILR